MISSNVGINTYVMRDRARPLKASLLSGARARTVRIVEINLDHIAFAAAIGLLLGYLFWGRP